MSYARYQKNKFSNLRSIFIYSDNEWEDLKSLESILEVKFENKLATVPISLY